jgi:hypothetical protein
LDQFDAGVLVDAVLGQRGEQLELVAAEPDRHLLAGQVCRRLDAGVLPGNLAHRAALEDLGDVDQVGALFARREQARHKVDAKVRLAARHHLFGHDVRATRVDRDVEAFGVVEAFALGGIVAGKLRLGHPLELQRDRVFGGAGRVGVRAGGLFRGGRGDRCGGRCGASAEHQGDHHQQG